MRYVLPVLVFLAFCLCILPVTASAPPGGEGWLTINCNVNGASVYLDDSLKGTIAGGSFDIEDGSQYSSYAVKKEGYYDASGEISYVPGGDSNLEIPVSLTPKPVGSGKGWFVVHCNVDGASVAFNGVTKGTISGGEFSLEVSTTGTPYTTLTVSKSGYVTDTESISMPADGQTIDLYPTLNPKPVTAPTTAPTTAATPIGGNVGWYAISCNVNGASVSFDSGYKGTISGGTLSVPVYSTGTPYTTYRVEKSGYISASGSLPAAPAKGQTVTVKVTLSPAGTQTPTPQPTATAAPPGSGQGYIAIHANVDGATVTVGSNTVGVIKNGVLKIPVSTTGTPYSAFTVSKAGYATTTGTVPRQPSAGETVDMYVTLTAEQTTMVPTTQSPASLPIIITGILGAVLILAVRRR
ncbi:MAG: hypothetical protein PHT99_01725 [Methanoregula sp.]|nr:hypothetical protein [Methanoregula sp.]